MRVSFRAGRRLCGQGAQVPLLRETFPAAARVAILQLRRWVDRGGELRGHHVLMWSISGAMLPGGVATSSAAVTEHDTTPHLSRSLSIYKEPSLPARRKIMMQHVFHDTLAIAPQSSQHPPCSPPKECLLVEAGSVFIREWGRDPPRVGRSRKGCDVLELTLPGVNNWPKPSQEGHLGVTPST